MRAEVTVHRPGSNQDLYAARVEQVARVAGALVTRELGLPLPQVRIVVTDGKGLAKLYQRCEKDLAAEGDEKLARRLSGFQDFGITSYLGATVLDSQGPVLLINGPKQRDLADLDATFVHELVHCVQMGRREKRQQYTAYLRKKYRGERSEAARTYLRHLDRDEREAIRLEHLTRQLPAPAHHM
jgi:hypothetical protein